MSMIRIAAAAAALLLAAACKPAAATAPEANEAPAAPAVAANAAEANVAVAEPVAAKPMVAIDGEGLRLVAAGSGSTRAIPFGTPQAEVLATLTALRGAPAIGGNDECGAGPMTMADWKDGLSLNFQEGKFVGWSIDKHGPTTLSTMDGLFVGATKADLLAGGGTVKIFESTIGTEFTVGEIGGLLDGPGSAANVTDLWAGTTCMFR